MNRRNFLRDMGAGFTSLALADMMTQDGFLSCASGRRWFSMGKPTATKSPHVCTKS